jgi:hypothetical protein
MAGSPCGSSPTPTSPCSHTSCPAGYGRPSTSLMGAAQRFLRPAGHVHADPQGQSLPVFGLAALLEFELLPRRPPQVHDFCPRPHRPIGRLLVTALSVVRSSTGPAAHPKAWPWPKPRDAYSAAANAAPGTHRQLLRAALLRVRGTRPSGCCGLARDRPPGVESVRRGADRTARFAQAIRR